MHRAQMKGWREEQRRRRMVEEGSSIIIPIVLLNFDVVSQTRVLVTVSWWAGWACAAWIARPSCRPRIARPTRWALAACPPFAWQPWRSGKSSRTLTSNPWSPPLSLLSWQTSFSWPSILSVGTWEAWSARWTLLSRRSWRPSPAWLTRWPGYSSDRHR